MNITPGPWKAGGVFVMQEGGGKQYIAVVDSCETSHRARRKQAPMLEEAYANAKAIAAIPDMHEAMRALLLLFIEGKHYNTQNPYTRPEVKAALKAYAAATGHAGDWMDALKAAGVPV